LPSPAPILETYGGGEQRERTGCAGRAAEFNKEQQPADRRRAAVPDVPASGGERAASEQKQRQEDQKGVAASITEDEEAVGTQQETHGERCQAARLDPRLNAKQSTRAAKAIHSDTWNRIPSPRFRPIGIGRIR
jgi:hypothetical protein